MAQDQAGQTPTEEREQGFSSLLPEHLGVRIGWLGEGKKCHDFLESL